MDLRFFSTEGVIFLAALEAQIKARSTVERHALDQMEITLLQKGKLKEFPCECPRKGNLFKPSQAFVRTLNGTFVVRLGGLHRVARHCLHTLR
jgi:hypothetical protein